MFYKFEYTSDSEKELIVKENPNLILVEVQNIFEGNFLIFSEEPLPSTTIYKNVSISEFEEVKNRLADLTELVLMGGM